MSIKLITELPSFGKKAAKIFDSEEIFELREFLRKNPEKGDVIVGTGAYAKCFGHLGAKENVVELG